MLLGLIAVVGICEWARWPFLVKPVEEMLSGTLRRPVALHEAGSEQRAGVRFIGGLRVWVPVLQIGAPAWSQRPYFLRAEQAEMRMRYGDLWEARRGGAIDIDHLRANHLTVHAERRLDGQASWLFADPNKKTDPTTDRDLSVPNVRELVVQQAEVTYQDAILKADIQGRVTLADGVDVDGVAHGLRASAEGRYGAAALSATLNAPGVRPLLATGDNAEPAAIALQVKNGRTSLSFQGTVTDVLHFRNMKGQVRASGPSLATAGDPLGITLPTTGPFSIQGSVSKEGRLWHFVTNETRVGETRLNAALSYDMRPAKPWLAGRVGGAKLLLADLLPTVAGEPAATVAPPVSDTGKPVPRASRVIPDKEFDLPSLRVMNANVLFAFDQADLGSAFAMPLQPLKAHLVLNDGKLLIKDIEARTADGNVGGEVALDGTGKVALYRADLRWSGVRLERWIKQVRSGDQPPYISGRLIGRAQLTGRGRSTAQILGSLDGTVFAALRGGQVSHLVIEGAGLDIAQALGVWLRGDEPLTVTCGMVDLKAEGGVLRPRAAVFDTTDSTVWIDGSLSLASETMDLRAIVSPKDFSPLALRTPLRVRGSFGSPQVSLQKDKLGLKVAASLLLGLVTPLAALIPLVDPGDTSAQGGKDADACPALLERARRAAGAKG